MYKSRLADSEKSDEPVQQVLKEMQNESHKRNQFAAVEVLGEIES